MAHEYATDHRWSPTASGATPPDDAPAVYTARWIDYGTHADVVHDRGGFAFDEQSAVDRLIDELNEVRAHHDIADMPRDVTHQLIQSDTLVMFGRRAGGYVYVCAWQPAGTQPSATE